MEILKSIFTCKCDYFIEKHEVNNKKPVTILNNKPPIQKKKKEKYDNELFEFSINKENNNNTAAISFSLSQIDIDNIINNKNNESIDDIFEITNSIK